VAPKSAGDLRVRIVGFLADVALDPATLRPLLPRPRQFHQRLHGLLNVLAAAPFRGRVEDVAADEDVGAWQAWKDRSEPSVPLVDLATGSCYSWWRQRSGAMRSTIEIDDSLLETARSLSGIKDTVPLVRQALETLIRVEAGRRLIALGGSMPDAEAAPGDGALHRRDPRRHLDLDRPLPACRSGVASDHRKRCLAVPSCCHR